MSSVVSFRVNKEIKEEMKKLKHINWSELLRQVVIKKIEEEKIKQQKNYDRIRLAAKRTDELRREIKGWLSTEEIRGWREKS